MSATRELCTELEPSSKRIKTEDSKSESLMPSQSHALMPRFEHGLFLAPMVRTGSLPCRLLSLEYGASLVWGPEVVDRAIMETERDVDPTTGVVEFRKGDKPVFSTHPIERPYLIYQLGSATPEFAAEAVRIVTQHDDVAGVDLNCGCPKPFSTLGGMGSNLLSTPDLLCDIIKAMRRAAPPHVSVSCKIRLLPTQEETFSLVEKIVRARAIRVLTIHCRTKPMRPREAALLERFRAVAEHVAKIAKETEQDVTVVCNGDCFSIADIPHLRELTGASSFMMARGPEANMSCFQPQRECTATVLAPKWLRYAIRTNNLFGNSKYCITQMAFTTTAGAKDTDAEKISPLKKRDLVEIRSALSASQTHEDMARALHLPWPLDTSDVLEHLQRKLEERAR